MFFLWHQVDVSSLFDPGNLLLGLLIDLDEVAAEAEHLKEEGLAQIGCHSRVSCLFFARFASRRLMFLLFDDCLRVEEPVEIRNEED